MSDSTTTLMMLTHKLRHSHNVAQNCRELAMALGHDEDFAVVAEFMGYVHDMGSLDEILRTGRWLHVEDHGQIGCDILVESSLFSLWPSEAFLAVRDHNAPTLADENNELLKILRDMDKLEILQYVCELIDAGRLQWLCDVFYEHTTTPKELCRSLLMWMDDINYQWTQQQIIKFDIVRKLTGVVG